MAATAIPGVLTALLNMFTTAQASTLAGVEVVDGPPTLVPAGTKQAIVVGGDWDPGEATIASSTFEPFSDYAQLETITVPCTVMVETGDPTTGTVTTRAFAIISAVKDLLTADPTLGGTVGYTADVSGGGKAEAASLARLTSLAPRRSVAGGARCIVPATITAQAVIPD